jgi:quercetin 2,3-dioxygenase
MKTTELPTVFIIDDDRGMRQAIQDLVESVVCGALLEEGSSTDYPLLACDAAYLVPTSGSVSVNGMRVGAREGLAIRGERRLHVEALVSTEVVLVVTRDNGESL